MLLVLYKIMQSHVDKVVSGDGIKSKSEIKYDVTVLDFAIINTWSMDRPAMILLRPCTV